MDDCRAAADFLTVIPAFCSPSFPIVHPVIPAKAGIQRVAAKFATRNQVQITANGSPLPLWERARARVRRAQTRLRRLDARAPRRKPTPISALAENDGVKIGNNSAIVASLRPLRLRAIASNPLCQHALVVSGWRSALWIPAFAGMTGWTIVNGGARNRE